MSRVRAPRQASGGNRRPKSNVELRVLIYFRAAGAIIGKGGENIRQFRDMEDIDDVTVPDRSSPERILTISGRTIEAVVECLQAMMDKLDEANAKFMGTSDTEVRMLIHQSQVGAVIGRGGSRVKEMKHSLHVDVLLLQYNCPQSSERIVYLSGTQESVAAGVQRILEICQETLPKGQYVLYDCVNWDRRYTEEYGGFVEMGAGRPLPPRTPRTPLTPHGQPDVFDYGAPPNGVLNSPPFRAAAGQGQQRFFQPSVRPHPANSYRVTPDYGQVPLGGPGIENMENESFVRVTLKQAELVIGRGGSRLRWIRSHTGAAISMMPEAAGDAEHRVFLLKGSQPQVTLAARLIQQSFGKGKAVPK